ncbi:hypothetical protein [Iningainema tapete]|nr:hypothetical protein [Iningainema tapete]
MNQFLGGLPRSIALNAGGGELGGSWRISMIAVITSSIFSSFRLPTFR